jgi:DNA-binding NarL/FixJ family response regulator
MAHGNAPGQVTWRCVRCCSRASFSLRPVRGTGICAAIATSEGRMGAGPFLILEDDESTARVLARMVRSHGVPVIARDARQALDILAGIACWSGFLLDVVLPDGSGIDVLAVARRMHPSTPALFLTGNSERATINSAFALGASCLLKPVPWKDVERFLASASVVGSAARLRRVVREWGRRYGLTQAEADVLERAALGVDRPAVAAERGTSELTVKRQVANILRRSQDSSLQGAVARLLREVAGVVQAEERNGRG